MKTLRFLLTLFLINFARWAKLRVDSVSPKHLDPGWTFAIIHVFALPPRESCLKKNPKKLALFAGLGLHQEAYYYNAKVCYTEVV